MEWLLILFLLILIPFGMWMMKKIDDFLALPTTFPDAKEQNTNHPLLLVFGTSDFADSLIRILEEKKEPFIHLIDENLSDLEQSYSCLFAADTDDYKNLSVSTIARVRFNIENQVLLCNDRIYEKIFQKSGEPFVFNTDEPNKMLLIGKRRIEDKDNDL